MFYAFAAAIGHRDKITRIASNKESTDPKLAPPPARDYFSVDRAESGIVLATHRRSGETFRFTGTPQEAVAAFAMYGDIPANVLAEYERLRG